MRFYGLFINDLIVDLQEGDMGVKIGPIKVPSPTFADDVAVATVTKDKLNKQLSKTDSTAVNGGLHTVQVKHYLLSVDVTKTPI